jgi:apolipoprotein N-acyltransferase
MTGRARFMVQFLAAVLSGVLVAVAFPLTPVFSSLDGPVAAWFGLLPLLLISLRSRPSVAWRWGVVSGFVMNAMTLWWLMRLGTTFGLWPLMILGWLALALYCALYWGLFAWLVSDCWLRIARRVSSPRARGVVMILVVPLFWVGLEYLRARLMTGFPWNPLGASQYRNLVVLRVATLGGVYAVSALLVIMNMALAAMANRAIDAANRMTGRRRFNVELALGLLVCALCWSWGVMDMRRSREEQPVGVARMTLVQPNLALMGTSESVESEDHYAVIMDQLDLARFSQPDLLLLPETALPTVLRYDSFTLGSLVEVVGTTPVLTGCLDADSPEAYDALRLYNAVMFLKSGEIAGVYRKQHLVPFGEYLPFVRWLPFDVPDPLGFDCVAGDDVALMLVPISDGQGGTQMVACASLVCFEDAFSGLAAKAVASGAQVLVNVTNDGWFERSGAARQHLAQSVLRAVEYGVPVVRCANSGVSCLIQKDGRVVQPIANVDEDGKVLSYEVRGSKPYRVPIYASRVRTLYARVGDWAFAFPAACLVVGFLLVGYLDYRKNGTHVGSQAS